MHRFLFAFFLAFFCHFALFAALPADSIDSGRGSVMLTVFRSGTMREDDPLNIYLVANKDTLHPTIQPYNNYYFEKVPVGLATAYCESSGFVTARQVVKVSRDSTSVVYLTMGEKVVQLKGVVVKGHVPAVVMRGDTIRFNPSAVTVYDNDDVRQILEQMPGVDVRDNSVSVNGKGVERTYVNGTTLFGSDPMKAIDHVSAKDVVTIKAYEEEKEEAERKRHKNDKRMVMDIITKEPIFNSTDLQFLAGVGGNTEKNHATGHDTRYFGGGTFNFFSDKWLSEVTLMHNNLSKRATLPSLFLNVRNMSPGSYGEETMAGGSIEKNTDPMYMYKETDSLKTSFKANYDFTRSASDLYLSSSTSYNPTTTFKERTYDNTSRTRNQNNTHRGGFDLTLSKNNIGIFKIKYGISNTHKRGSQHSEVVNNTDGEVSKGVLNTASRGTLRSNTIDVNWSKTTGKWLYITNLNGSMDSNDNDEQRTNNINSQNQLSLINNRQKSYSLSVTPSMSYNLDAFTQLTLSYTMNLSNEKDKQFGTDMMTGSIDSTNTYSYKSHTISHSPGIGIGNMGFKFDIDWQSTKVVDEDKMFGHQKYDNTFNAIVASSMIDFKNLFKLNKEFNLFQLQYDLKSNIPQYDQLRLQLDNSNPYYITSGNPGLKAETQHNWVFDLQHDIDNRGQYVLVKLSANVFHNSVVGRSLYFKEETPLPDYHYNAVAGSTLSTYDNINGKWDMNVFFTYTKPLTKIRSSLSLDLTWFHNHDPFYYNGVKGESNRNGYTGAFSFKTSAVKRMRLNSNIRYNYNKTSATVQSLGSWNSSLTAHVDGQYQLFWKYCFAKASYDFRLRQYGGDIPTTHEHILNLYVGTRLFKRQAELSVTAYDLLHSMKSNKTVYRDNYVSYQTQENYGSYFTVNFTWSFRNVKSNRMNVQQGRSW